MRKKHFKKKNHKPFNPIRNVEKLQELRPKLRKYESHNNGRDPKVSSSPSEEKKRLMFSERDKEYVLHIGNLLAQKGIMVEYLEKKNGFTFSIKGDSDIHHLGISCCSDVLKIFSLKDLYGVSSRCSNEAFKQIMHLNFKIQVGGFCYVPESDSITYYLGVPLYEKPKRKFVESLIMHVVKVIDNCVPAVISYIDQAKHWKKKAKSPTFH
jgi:hypothetical protein